jgi:hypothetical protein
MGQVRKRVSDGREGEQTCMTVHRPRHVLIAKDRASQYIADGRKFLRHGLNWEPVAKDTFRTIRQRHPTRTRETFAERD